MIVNEIKNPSFLKDLPLSEIEKLCSQIHQFLIENLTQTGGHFSSNLGVIELTTMLHRAFDFSSKNKLIFDIGHQSYVHKILTGRAKQISTIRKYNGLSGFQSLNESSYDHWEAGHAGTSLSAALGYAIGLQNYKLKTPHIVCLIGDASFSNGMALEALNDVGNHRDQKIILILNDNGMSISKNVNFLSYYASLIISQRPLVKGWSKLKKMFTFLNYIEKKIKTNVSFFDFFKFFNLDYLGPFNGHNLQEIENSLELAKKHNSSIVLHYKTVKGNGYMQAQNDTNGHYHAISKHNNTAKSISWSEATSNIVLQQMQKNKKIYAITPGMINGSKLNNLFIKYPERCIDVGIAEEHAVTLSAGLALSSLKPVVFIYSTFLQRAYDQINHDVCALKLPVVFVVDRCGFATGDGRTHHGIFDINLLHNLPNAVIAAPDDKHQTEFLLNWGLQQNENALFMRISKKPINHQPHVKYINRDLSCGSWIHDRRQWENTPGVIISYGDDLAYISKIINHNKKLTKKFALINALWLKPFDVALLMQLIKENKKIVIFERLYADSGLGMIVSNYMHLNQINYPLHILALKNNTYIHHGEVDKLLSSTNLSLLAIEEYLQSV